MRSRCCTHRCRMSVVLACSFLAGLCVLSVLSHMGCGTSSTPIPEMQRELRAAVSELESPAGDPGSREGFIHLLSLMEEYDEIALARSLRQLHCDCSKLEYAVKLSRALRIIGLRVESPEARRETCELARVLLREESPEVMRNALEVVERNAPAEAMQMVNRRLEAATSVTAWKCLIEWLAKHREWAALKEQLAQPPPTERGKAAVAQWRARRRAALETCLFTYTLEADNPPEDLVWAITRTIPADPTMAGSSIRVLVSVGHPEQIRRNLMKVEQLLPPGSTATFWREAALVALSDSPLDSASNALEGLERAVDRHRKGQECWSEICARASSLAFAAGQARSREFLGAICSACKGMVLRDRAELLSLMLEESRPFSAAEYLLFLDTIPREDLRNMAQTFPQLNTMIRILASRFTGPTEPSPSSLTSKDLFTTAQRVLASLP